MNYADLQNNILDEVFDTTYSEEAGFWRQFKKTEVYEAIEKESTIKITENKIIFDEDDIFTLHIDHLFNHLIISNKVPTSGGAFITYHSQYSSNTFLAENELIKNILKKVCEIRGLDGYALALPSHLEFGLERYLMDNYECLHEGENVINDELAIYNFNRAIFRMFNTGSKNASDYSDEAGKYGFLIGCYTDTFVQKVENLGVFFDEFINNIRKNYLVFFCDDLIEPLPDIVRSFAKFKNYLKLTPFTKICYENGSARLLQIKKAEGNITFVFKLDFESLLEYLNGKEETPPLSIEIFDTVNPPPFLKHINDVTLDSFKDYLLSFESDEDSIELNVLDHSQTLTHFIKRTAAAQFLQSKQYNESKALAHLSSCYEDKHEKLLQILNSEDANFFEYVHCKQEKEQRKYEKFILKIATQDKNSCSVLLIEYDENADTFNYESYTTDSTTSIYSFLR